MAPDTYPDENGPDVYEDFEEHVDQDDHEKARAFVRRKQVKEEEALERHEDHYDEYSYGEDSGEAYEKSP